MSENGKTALEKHGGLLGLAGIGVFLVSKMLGPGHTASIYATLAGLAILVIGCFLLAVAHLMKKEPGRAVEAFTEVELLEGRRAAEARKLIEAIQEIG